LINLIFLNKSKIGALALNDFKMKNYYFFVIVLLAALFFASCNNEVEPIPSYVHVNEFIVNVDVNNQGSSASKLTDVWVSNGSNGDFLGVYELPATFPLLEFGTTNLILEPGIKVNGISATPDIYPMMNRYQIEVDLEANVIDTIQPLTDYRFDAEFFYTESFDNFNTLTITFDSSNVVPTIVDTGAFEGKSANFKVTENEPLIEVATQDRMNIPTDRGTAFLEMHYKSEGILQVGLVGYEAGSNDPIRNYFFVLNPSDDWNKIYINLTPELIASAAGIDEFQILFGAQLGSNATETEYWIDNLKVIRKDN